jgi:Calcium-activated chloride channel
LQGTRHAISNFCFSRWISMNERFLDRMWQQTFTFMATFASICLGAFIVRILHDWSNLFSAFAISIFNGVFPEFAKILVKFEGHATEAGVQTSMYLKICLFRWVNTAVVITIITTCVKKCSGTAIASVKLKCILTFFSSLADSRRRCPRILVVSLLRSMHCSLLRSSP